MQDTSDRMQTFDKQLFRWVTAMRWQKEWLELLHRRADALEEQRSIPPEWWSHVRNWLDMVERTAPSPLPENVAATLHALIEESVQTGCHAVTPTPGELVRVDDLAHRLMVWIMAPLKEYAWDCAGRAVTRSDEGHSAPDKESGPRR
jgi:hypothetical protein